LTDVFSGAEIEGICNRAAISSIRRYVDKKEKNIKSIKITQEDFLNAIQKMRPPAPKQKQTTPAII
jgi:transitional endoplasmic reticulum ATPase